ncbi:FKBP-type peptidyl-prolyl cis-trans isomerase [Erythrobacter insulae]|uniref:Peptidyl-prolyl cis-trans isomerase n=2 Tax=Erythrobacter insulae TaxID=2584124 RepID=A0A547PF27_9SPHN|nr:FKBP-type peptidyl-prolyl cis-trans isomerase [Erythrobacter insulae]
MAATPLLAQDESAKAADPADGSAEQAKNDLAWHSAQQTYLFGLTAADGWRQMNGGLRWRWTEYNGSDERPSVADVVTVHYEGKLIDGTVFDSSYPRGEPATFPLGRLIPGWQMAIPQMGVGETIEIAVPADLAYGPVGRGPIPGNATLVFKVELIGIAE